MLKRDYTQLAIYTIKDNEKEVPIHYLKELFLTKTSEIIYIVRNRKLYGIVCLGDVLHKSYNGKVLINKNFVYLVGYNIIQAHRLLKERTKICKIPVVNKEGILLGDYSRWDDILFIQRNLVQWTKIGLVEKIFHVYKKVYLIEPVQYKNQYFKQMQRLLDICCVDYQILEKQRMGEKLSEESICIVVDEDERRGIQCYYEIEIYAYDVNGNDMLRYDKNVDTDIKLRIATYKSIFFENSYRLELQELNMQRDACRYTHDINGKATALLNALESCGIKCFCIYGEDNRTELSNYSKIFRKEIEKRQQTFANIKEPWQKKIENEEFYGELYQNRDYESEAAQREIYRASCDYKYQKYEEISGKYFNAKAGKRITLYQPENYIGTIYMLGPCTIVGMYVEDQYTIASFLQKKLLDKGFQYRVENCGITMRADSGIDSRLMEIDDYDKNDIVIYQTDASEIVNIEGVTLEEIFTEHDIPSGWVTGQFVHCNHKANEKIADGLINKIEPFLSNNKIKNSEKIQVDFDKVMRNYIKHKYLDRFFSQFNPNKYLSIGAIVMNCNPFSKGHRYLIEISKQHVDFLIIFVVEEDESLFSFEERFQLVKEGTDDLENVMIVPSGDFILSKNNLREYFLKEEDAPTFINAEYDINIFVNYIARPLHITCRFAGEEPEDNITQIYNDVMRNILPKKGIQFVEFERVKDEDTIISASKVRKYLELGDYDEAFRMLPETTIQYLKQQIK